MSDVVDLVTLLMQCHGRRKGEGGADPLDFETWHFPIKF